MSNSFISSKLPNYSSGPNKHVHCPHTYLFIHTKKSHQHAFFHPIRFELLLKSCIFTYKKWTKCHRYFKINVQKCVKVWGRIRPAFRPLHKVNEIRVMQEKCNNNGASGNEGLMGTIPSNFFAEVQKVKPVKFIT